MGLGGPEGTVEFRYYFIDEVGAIDILQSRVDAPGFAVHV